MKLKQKLDFGCSLLLLILSCIILLLPTFGFTNIKTILITIFGGYALIRFIQFISTKKEKDYQSLFTSIASIIALLAIIFMNINTQKIVLILLLWIALISIIKLKKADFYHDRKNKMWLLRILILFIFITSGLLMSINLFYDSSAQIIIIGFFFFINSCLEIIDPIVIDIMEKWNETS